MNRPYFAPNGHEMVDIIVSRVKRGLLETGAFPIHKTFPEVSFNFTVELEVYPSEPKYMKHQIKGHEFIDEPRIGPKIVKVEGGIEGIGTTIPPDKVRIEEGLKLAKPVTKPNVGTVDELVDSLEQAKK